MFAALFRILFGLLIACLFAGAVQVTFALTPNELIVAGPDRWLIAAAWALDSATVIALVAVPLGFLAGLFSEIVRVRSFAYHVLAGIFIALSGFGILYAGEGPGDPTLGNSYAIAAYLTTGFAGGLAYWIISGRFAGGRRAGARADLTPEPVVEATKTTVTSTSTTVPVTRQATTPRTDDSGNAQPVGA